MHSVFTLSTSPDHPGLLRLKASAEKFGWPLEVHHPYLGPRREDRTYEKFLEVKHHYIKDILSRRKGWFLYVDAWDSVFVNHFYIPEGEGLWFAGEKNLYPRVDYGLNVPFRPETLFPYLNTGIIWGDVSEYLRLCPKAVGHDQEMWIRKWCENVDVQVDHWATYGLNLHSTKPEELSRIAGGVVRYNPTNTEPYILHGNGKWPLPNWLEV